MPREKLQPTGSFLPDRPTLPVPDEAEREAAFGLLVTDLKLAARYARKRQLFRET